MDFQPLPLLSAVIWFIQTFPTESIILTCVIGAYIGAKLAFYFN